MAHRSFTDSLGRKWEVWTVIPSRVERRNMANGAPTEAERRRHQEFRVRMDRKWIEGWLAFETGGDKRRIAPIPDGWEAMDVRELESLVNRATPVPPGRRLVE